MSNSRSVSSGNADLNDYDIMECIADALNRFGPSINYTVMWRMIVMGEDPKEGILSNPRAFLMALRGIFGVASEQIEQEVLDQIKSRAEAQFSAVTNFVDLVNALRSEQRNSPVDTIPA